MTSKGCWSSCFLGAVQNVLCFFIAHNFTIWFVGVLIAFRWFILRVLGVSRQARIRNLGLNTSQHFSLSGRSW